ncbi:metal-dependent amidase/aminoacylase/carboxypeptidase family protein [Paraburkholderia sp. Cpub6]|nr:metal-dependent amidase/aminoacylase/carboxypeptidase family protein [Paraburkholderia sp. Cpub6]
MSKLIEAIYKDLYAHAELSMRALRTAGIVADQVETIQ